eukprot:834194-Pyramimonas_sp.AAC.1
MECAGSASSGVALPFGERAVVLDWQGRAGLHGQPRRISRRPAGRAAKEEAEEGCRGFGTGPGRGD